MIFRSYLIKWTYHAAVMLELLTKQGQFANKNHVIFLVSRKLHSSFKEILLYHAGLPPFTKWSQDKKNGFTL